MPLRLDARRDGLSPRQSRLRRQRIEIEKPEILLYEKRPDGSYRLNGVEYIIPYRLWPKDSVPPKLMGRDMLKSDELLWYTHMWIWTPNSAGLFADWNPAVKCG